jgi:putative Flp pilus-assembly TadE/G-like protein
MKRHSQAGQTLVLAAFGLVVLTGVVGLSIDMGYLRYTKRRMQTAADSAAIAAASELNGGDSTAAAINDATVNGFQDGVNGASVTVFPPTDPPFAGLPNHIEVQVQQTAPTFFMRVFKINQAQLSTTAVARLGTSKGCVYGLGLLGGLLGGIGLNGHNLTATQCGVVDNSLLNLGGGCINAASIGVVLNLLGGGCTTPQPILGIAPSPDPLAYLAPPGGGGCNRPGQDINDPNAGDVVTLQPGTYCGAIVIEPGNRAHVVFAPGLYIIIVAPGLQIGGVGIVTGAGVTFFLGGGASANITGAGTITLTAPVDAPIAGIPGGILFFQDRGNGLPANITGVGLFLAGALYFPNAPLTLGPTAPSPYLILVSQTIQLNGDVPIGTDYTSLTNGSPIKSAVLVR